MSKLIRAPRSTPLPTLCLVFSAPLHRAQAVFGHGRVVTYIVIWEHIWEKGPIGNWSHHVGFILELCSKYEITS